MSAHICITVELCNGGEFVDLKRTQNYHRMCMLMLSIVIPVYPSDNGVRHRPLWLIHHPSRTIISDLLSTPTLQESENLARTRHQPSMVSAQIRDWCWSDVHISLLGTRHAILVDHRCGILAILYTAQIWVQSESSWWGCWEVGNPWNGSHIVPPYANETRRTRNIHTGSGAKTSLRQLKTFWRKEVWGYICCPLGPNTCTTMSMEAAIVLGFIPFTERCISRHYKSSRY